ncbi:MAG TPA: ABC transporter ATP-binding protein, partial [Ktedonobacteraceae bacterium]|nr:ABC transporter ATP-binding protein [Ktedonobacteraceae bacterium]
TLLFVSHDRYFIDSLATRVWVIEDGVLIPYMGNYTGYRTRKQPIVLDVPVSARARDGSNETTTTKAVAPTSKAKGRKSSKVKARTLEDVEGDIEKAEERVKTVEEALAGAALKADAAALTQLTVEYEQARAYVDELLAEWERLSFEAG